MPVTNPSNNKRKRTLIIFGVLLVVGLVATVIVTTVQQSLSGRSRAATDPLAANCTVTVASNVDKVDGRKSPYTSLEAGDVICVRPGARDELDFHNLRGAPGKPITIVNFGGQVVFSGRGDHAITLYNSRYIHFTGSGDINFPYGFKADGGTSRRYSRGLNIDNKSSDIEVDHIEVHNISGTGIGANTHASCADGSDNKFDYDGDGQEKGDLDDLVTTSFIQYNTVVHHTWIDNTLGEGFYIGSNRTVLSSSGQGTQVCANGQQAPLNPVLEGVDIYENKLENIGKDAINVKGVTKGCFIHNNKVYGSGVNPDRTESQSGAVNISLNATCDIYSNYLEGGKGPGIRHNGTGGRIYNNVITKSGVGLAATNRSANGMWLNGSDLPNDAPLLVWNNTVVNAVGMGIEMKYEKVAGNIIANNLVVSSSSRFITTSSKTKVSLLTNYTTTNETVAGFANAAVSDFGVQSTSPVVNKGTASGTGIPTVDFRSVPRPQGGGYDIGAYEYTTNPVTVTPTQVPTVTPVVTTTPTPVITSAPTPTPTPPGGGLAVSGQLTVARVRASSSTSPTKPAYVIDSDYATNWTTSGKGQWIRFDLGQRQNVRSVHIAWVQGDQRTATFDVQVSNNGSDWTRVYRGTSKGTNGLEKFSFSRARARYVRIVNRGNNLNSQISLSEVRVASVQ